MDAERPERVLVRADDPEVLAVAVDAEHLAELTRADHLLQPPDARVVEEQVARHQDEVAFLGERDELVHLGAHHRGRLLDQDVLAGSERAPRELEVGRDRRRDDDGVELVVGEHLVEARRSSAPAGSERRGLASCRIRVAEPGELRQLGEVAREVRSPVAEPATPTRTRHSFQTLSEPFPLAPVALRRSTTSAPPPRARS